MKETSVYSRVISCIMIVTCIPKAALAFSSSIQHKRMEPSLLMGTRLHTPPFMLMRPRNNLGRVNAPLCSTFSDKNNEEEAEEKFPEITYIDYDDPNYVVDQGLVDGEEMFAGGESDEETLEKWREERRAANDEFQFETYYRSIQSNGAEYRGEWTTYGSTTFIPESGFDRNENGGYPGIVMAKRVKKVISAAMRVLKDEGAERRCDQDVIVHEEFEITSEKGEETLKKTRDTDIDGGFGRHNDDEDGEDGSSSRTPILERYAPSEMRAFDFRGEQGNMCVGNAYTICNTIKLDELSENNDDHDGPFSEMRAEVGINGENVRMRVKFEYQILSDEEKTKKRPDLHLSTMTVCRERKGEWPSSSRDVELFGPPGARGGLYDPPPTGGEEQSNLYMWMDVEGGATIGFPYMITQDPDAFQHDGGLGHSWVLSLDWTPGKNRYQADRKFAGGEKIKGLKTFEVSEVEALESDKWRPKNGPEDMRQ
eukprot:CAMPEP_0195530926 /NCGR_PEP_ID=MMETSP0794_2-20130614/34052_1 /TAXON_ID=515487 /ORGANISM="Stephanopyxis turris, Strain CCMP 815" /LENGTH=481 /DNA_ID=CAMNT_0040662549 /DNA_START=38 /DNA_END=1483 /DNA_ORIENTATION=+